MADDGAKLPHAHHFTPDDWQALDDTPAFHDLVAAKRRFIIPATAFFVVYYFSLPVLVGYYPAFMSRNVFGNITLAYVFALSQFLMAWLVMFCYVRRARRFDEMESRIVANAKVIDR